MNFEQFEDWVHGEVREGRLLAYQAVDLLVQRILFDQNRLWMQREFLMKVVGYVASERYVNPTVAGLLDFAGRAFPNRMLYFEPIGFELAL